MRKISVKTPFGAGGIYIGQEALEARLPALTKGQENFVVTDENVYTLYGNFFKRYFAETHAIVLPAGEAHKNFQTLYQILECMSQVGLHRTARLFAVGGGVVGDIAGLAASLYMRGIDYVQIPTTLLAQVDSSVGGKTAVDLNGVKNVIGAFHQPMEVLVDPTFLKTLSAREIKCGLGEIVKYGTLDEEIFDLLDTRQAEFDSLDFLEELLVACIRKKVAVVELDERESGERKCLNIGHTTGHAIELWSGLSHGESVLYGMYLETKLSMDAGICDIAYGEKLLKIVENALRVQPQNEVDLTEVDEYVSLAMLDKKNLGDGKIQMAVAKEKGKWTMLSLDFDEYKLVLQTVAQEMPILQR
ncbi:MAG: 3-dehydroquinate synthase [Clostridia bacterium]|nr:3-dehydroquinate synthase [Clostridia bacterium]